MYVVLVKAEGFGDGDYIFEADSFSIDATYLAGDQIGLFAEHVPFGWELLDEGGEKTADYFTSVYFNTDIEFLDVCATPMDDATRAIAPPRSQVRHYCVLTIGHAGLHASGPYRW